MRTLLDDLYDKEERIQIEIREIKKEIRKAKASQKRIESKIVNKRLEEEELKNLLKIREDVKQKERKTRSREVPGRKTIPKGEGESDREEPRNKRIQKRPNSKRIQGGRGEGRPEEGEEGRSDSLVQREVDSNRSILDERRESEVRRGTGAKRKPRVSSNRESESKDSYYIKRVSRKAREESRIEDGEEEGEVSSTESELGEP
jgi:hypothetical protein